MQACRWFVQQIQSASRIRSSQFGSEFHTLCFSTGKCWSALPQCYIVQSDVTQRLQDSTNLRNVREVLECFAARHLQYIVNRPAVVSHGQSVFVVATALARIALDPDIWQEVHLDTDLAVTKTFLAASTGYVEAKSPSGKATDLGVRQLCEQFSN